MEASSLGFSAGFSGHLLENPALRRSSVCEGKEAKSILLKKESLDEIKAHGGGGGPNQLTNKKMGGGGAGL